MRRRLDAAGYQEVKHAATARPRAVGSAPATGRSSASTCSSPRSRTRTNARAEADELPRATCRSSTRACAAIANCRCAWPSSAPATATSPRARCTASCACAPSPRTTRISSAPRTRSPPRRSRFVDLLSVDLRAIFGFAEFRVKFSDRPDRCAPARTRSGTRPEAALKERLRERRRRIRRSTPARAPSTAPSWNSCCATRSAATGSAARCRSISCCPSGWTPNTSARTAPRTAR